MNHLNIFMTISFKNLSVDSVRPSILIAVIVYLFAINIFSFVLYYIDKKKAIKHRWRIPESSLLAAAFFGGSLGALAAMKIFRHKTKHPKFYILVPLMLLLHIIIIIYLSVHIKIR